MPRLGRYFVEDQPLHVIQRGNNRQNIFADDDHFRRYAGWLGEAAADQGCRIHAYVLMSNHVHLLLTPARPSSLPRMMQTLGRRYVGWFNRVQRRTGTLWEGRYRATPVDSEAYLLRCHRYIELNPVRAHMVERPEQYCWSSYGGNARGAADPLLSPHALYLALGATPAERCRAYHAMFRDVLDEAFLEAVRGATNAGWALGDAGFRCRMSGLANRRAGPLAAGRRPAPQVAERQLTLV